MEHLLAIEILKSSYIGDDSALSFTYHVKGEEVA